MGLHSLPTYHRVIFSRVGAAAPPVRESAPSLELQWAPGQWQPGGGAQPRLLGEAATPERAGWASKPPAVLVLYYCKGSRKLSFSTVGSCRVLFQPPSPPATQASLRLASACQSLGRLSCREECKIMMVVSGESGCIFAKLYTCCGLCSLFY